MPRDTQSSRLKTSLLSKGSFAGTKSRELFHGFGSFLGVSDDDGLESEQWQERLADHVKSGHVGVNLPELWRYQANTTNEIVKHLEETLSQVNIESLHDEEFWEADIEQSTRVQQDRQLSVESVTGEWDLNKGVIAKARFTDASKCIHTINRCQSSYENVKGYSKKSNASLTSYVTAAKGKSLTRFISHSRTNVGLDDSQIDRPMLSAFEDKEAFIDLTKPAYTEKTGENDTSFSPVKDGPSEKDTLLVSDSNHKIPKIPGAKHIQFNFQVGQGNPVYVDDFSPHLQLKLRRTSSSLSQFSNTSSEDRLSAVIPITGHVTSEVLQNSGQDLSRFQNCMFKDLSMDESSASEMHQLASSSTSIFEHEKSNLQQTVSPSDVRSLRMMDSQSDTKARASVKFATVVSAANMGREASLSKSILKKKHLREQQIKHQAAEENSSHKVRESILRVSEVKEAPTDFVFKREAFGHYKDYVQLEQSERSKHLKRRKEDLRKQLMWRYDKIEESLDIAKDHYAHGSGSATIKKRWDDLRNSISTHNVRCLPKEDVYIRRQLEELPSFRAWFIYLVSLLQLIALIVTCGLGGIDTIGLTPQLQTKGSIRTFLGLETIDQWHYPNLWIGPSEAYLISIGAAYAPCMRDDYKVNLQYVDERYHSNAPLGCCEISVRNTAGTTTEDECNGLTNDVGKWNGNFTCTSRPAGRNSVLQRMKPCCIGLQCHCQLVSYEHCAFLGGIYHYDIEHCTQVNCLKSICSLGNMDSDSEKSYKAANPHQFWRLPLSLFYHYGIIHTILVLVVQIMVGRQIEVLAGWLRVFIIYLISGLGGLMVGMVSSPYSHHVGGSGAVCGLFGVLLVELLQSWRLVNKPWRELLKLAVATVILLFVGTLPAINNFTHVGGLYFGVLSAILVLPYISFGKWHANRRKLLIACTLILLVGSLLTLVYIFYIMQPYFENTSLFNCIPYSANLCLKTM